MPKPSLLALLAAGTLISTPLFAAGGKIGNVVPKLTLIGNPQLNVTVPGMSPKLPRPPAPGESKVWLEFEADFECAEDFPELTIRYGLLIAIPGKATKLVEGEVTHVDVTKGKDRHSVMYVAPKTLTKLGDGKPFTPQTHVKAYWVEFVSQGESVGVGIKSSAGVTFEAVKAGKDALEKVNDALLGKHQTPFAPLFTDYFETFKATR